MLGTQSRHTLTPNPLLLLVLVTAVRGTVMPRDPEKGRAFH